MGPQSQCVNLEGGAHTRDLVIIWAGSRLICWVTEPEVTTPSHTAPREGPTANSGLQSMPASSCPFVTLAGDMRQGHSARLPLICHSGKFLADTKYAACSPEVPIIQMRSMGSEDHQPSQSQAL